MWQDQVTQMLRKALISLHEQSKHSYRTVNCLRVAEWNYLVQGHCAYAFDQLDTELCVGLQEGTALKVLYQGLESEVKYDKVICTGAVDVCK